jgi:hypothetical protein
MERDSAAILLLTHGFRTGSEERDGYEALIRLGNFVAILQAKARRLLATLTQSDEPLLI